MKSLLAEFEKRFAALYLFGRLVREIWIEGGNEIDDELTHSLAKCASIFQPSYITMVRDGVLDGPLSEVIYVFVAIKRNNSHPIGLHRISFNHLAIIARACDELELSFCKKSFLICVRIYQIHASYTRRRSASSYCTLCCDVCLYCAYVGGCRFGLMRVALINCLNVLCISASEHCAFCLIACVA